MLYILKIGLFNNFYLLIFYLYYIFIIFSNIYAKLLLLLGLKVHDFSDFLAELQKCFRSHKSDGPVQALDLEPH